jgi:hypothetical protein
LGSTQTQAVVYRHRAAIFATACSMPHLQGMEEGMLSLCGPAALDPSPSDEVVAVAWGSGDVLVSAHSSGERTQGVQGPRDRVAVRSWPAGTAHCNALVMALAADRTSVSLLQGCIVDHGRLLLDILFITHGVSQRRRRSQELDMGWLTSADEACAALP